MSKTALLFTSMVRYRVSETAERGIDKTIIAFEGHAYFVDQEVERRYRDYQVLWIYEGTVEIQLNRMTRVLYKLNPDVMVSSMLLFVALG